MYRLGALTHLDTTTGITSITGVMLPSTQPVSQLSGFTFARASLEGMPADLRLEIMLHLPDLSTLRLLKLASREYYFTARACEHSLAAVHRFHTCHYIRNDPRLKWLRSMEETLFTGQPVLLNCSVAFLKFTNTLLQRRKSGIPTSIPAAATIPSG